MQLASVLEATGGIEPPNRGFANPCLNHLATSPPALQSNRKPLVPRVGLEPTRSFEHYALNVACLPISASRRNTKFAASCGRSGRIRTRDLWFWRPTL